MRFLWSHDVVARLNGSLDSFPHDERTRSLNKSTAEILHLCRQDNQHSQNGHEDIDSAARPPIDLRSIKKE